MVVIRFHILLQSSIGRLVWFFENGNSILPEGNSWCLFSSQYWYYIFWNLWEGRGVSIWLHYDYIMTTFWLHSGYILATFWLHSDYLLTTFWLHSGYILTTFWLHSCFFIDSNSSQTNDSHQIDPLSDVWMRGRSQGNMWGWIHTFKFYHQWHNCLSQFFLR